MLYFVFTNTPMATCFCYLITITENQIIVTFALVNLRIMLQRRQPITEAGFLQEPLGKQYFDYARHTAASFIRDVELKWNPGRSGMSLDDLVMETVVAAIDLTKQDYAKGVFRNEKEKSFKQFFWWRIKKTFFDKLKELGKDPNQAIFDEGLAKYYEGTAVDLGPNDEKNDTVLFYYSEEKAAVLDESHEAKMQYVKRILDIVSRMSPSDQRLFYLKYQLNFSDEDYQLWKSIGKQKHVKDPFTKMAQARFGLSENYAKKRICQIKADISAKLNQSGSTQASYKEDTSLPTMLQSLTVSRPRPVFDIDIDNLSEADCQDILFELYF
ncbi:MAG: hypothetical protein J5639_02220 [Bacteroidales bacterium]|nr:hypothetical protein [Bacteroidales bacterium]